ncbi:MFS transporter [Methylorubrum extorquens]|uniref:MFS transporter n=1 Tax=Methylorubrum extorquens TaxID=408 RepID=UPI000158EFD3|nr:MFS transporter [Methylorubrum extorquens]ABY30315.1 major facilitator superfamily MFS_1 [Methylorubrum extorquens PA1]KQP89296.1 MFS transporter [Methylobacterium sp. Leaf119]WIU41606.1 MFS transporter [Methylorubrum extorquens]
MSGRGRLTVISALGVVEILAWGSSFYLPAVLAGPIAADTGWPLAWVVGGLSIGLLVAAVASPRVGIAIQRHGGRPVLALAAVLLAVGLAALGLAPNLPAFLAGWLVVGLGMGCGLYDPAFATLGRLYGSEARPAITTLTLWGGFASTVCWPLSAFLVEQVGWRHACLAYAGLHLLVTLPLVLGLIPRAPAAEAARGEVHHRGGMLTARERRAFLLMAGVLVLGGAVMTLVSVHLITLLQARGVALAAAVSYGALIGPAQVGARIVEMAGKGRHHPLWTLTAAMVLVAAGLAVLAAGIPAVGLALVLYGAGNGIYSIARGTVPLSLFGPERYATLVGRLARPGLAAQALAPSLGAAALAYGGADTAYVLLLALALANVVLVAALWGAR